VDYWDYRRATNISGSLHKSCVGVDEAKVIFVAIKKKIAPYNSFKT